MFKRRIVMQHQRLGLGCVSSWCVLTHGTRGTDQPEPETRLVTSLHFVRYNSAFIHVFAGAQHCELFRGYVCMRCSVVGVLMSSVVKRSFQMMLSGHSPDFECSREAPGVVEAANKDAEADRSRRGGGGEEEGGGRGRGSGKVMESVWCEAGGVGVVESNEEEDEVEACVRNGERGRARADIFDVMAIVFRWLLPVTTATAQRERRTRERVIKAVNRMQMRMAWVSELPCIKHNTRHQVLTRRFGKLMQKSNSPSATDDCNVK